MSTAKNAPGEMVSDKKCQNSLVPYGDFDNFGTFGGVIKKAATELTIAAFLILRSTDLLSHTLTSTLPSALRGLTTVFGMGTGVSPSV